MKTTLRCLALALVGMAIAIPASAYTLQGRVLDAATLAPIANADVTVNVVIPDSLFVATTSDESGFYLVSGLPPGNEVYAVVCWKTGYQYSYARVDGLASGDLTYDILMSLPPPPPPPPPPGEPPSDSGIVSGRVLAPNPSGTLQAVTGATVQLQSGAGQVAAETDAQGMYAMLVVFGTYSVSVTAAGHDRLDESGLAVGQDGVRFDAVLQPSSNAEVPEANGPPRVWLGRTAPNPVRGGATMFYALSAPGDVELVLFDAAGRRVRTLVSAWQQAGQHAVSFGSGGLPSGTYFCRLRLRDATATKALQIIR